MKLSIEAVSWRGDKLKESEVKELIVNGDKIKGTEINPKEDFERDNSLSNTIVIQVTAGKSSN